MGRTLFLFLFCFDSITFRSEDILGLTRLAITMKETLGQNHARNRMSATLRRSFITEVCEPGDFPGFGTTTSGILEVEPTLRA